jgi:pyrimidine-nucleoside phosphorylase
MNPVELIRKKRDGLALTRAELQAFIASYLEGKIPDYQMSALLMAVYFRGMEPGETAAFTEVMLHSGCVADLSGIAAAKVDKHSTGGAGDKVSLILAPMVAACGIAVPMISGRGLGHTGGTLDKLESIPGFRTALGIDEFRRVIEKTGLAMIGQTGEIAPADRRMYALRDVTATVESVPLIAGSIMSKKLAEGIDALVLDVKTGAGAFMQRYEDSLALARTLVGIGTRFGKKTVALITEMDQPLGFAIGNWTEVVEAVSCLKGAWVADLMEVTYALGALMLVAGGRARGVREGLRLCREAIRSGGAYEKFLALVRAQGGDGSRLERPSLAPDPEARVECRAARSGYICGFSTREVGVLAVEMGAGRMSVEDAIDMSAGITLRKKLGDAVEEGETLAVLYGADPEKVASAARAFPALVALGAEPPARTPRCRTVVHAGGEEPWADTEELPGA